VTRAALSTHLRTAPASGTLAVARSTAADSGRRAAKLRGTATVLTTVKAAAAAIPGLRALSPNYGFPQNGKVGDPGFRFYPDGAMVSEAHARGLKVIPWTCDDPATVEALMDMGVDGIITNYPNHVRQIMAARGMRLPKAYEPR
jgi:glycerophosphoryl diester phosphodiesterase